MKAIGFALLLSITNVFIAHVHSLTASPRRSSSCAFLKGKIYCYGGESTADNNYFSYDNSLLVLDLTVSYHTSINNEWQIISDAEGSAIAADGRSTAQTAVYGDGDTMIVSGGFRESSALSNQTIAYTASSNSWRVIDRFYDGINGERQIYFGTSIYVPTQQKFYFFGGLEQYPLHGWYLDTVANTNFTDTANVNLTRGYVGYYRMATLDLGLYSTWTVVPNQNQFAPNMNYYLQTVVFHPDSQTLYYFGGSYYNLSDPTADGVSQSFGQAMTFNTTTSTWGVQAFTGDVPLKRVVHTTTLMPSNQDVLLYGGASDIYAPAVSDFCYIANLQTFTWKLHSDYLKLDSGQSASRAEHSAVLVDTKLFILFGYVTDKAALANDAVLILDVSNPERLSFVSQYAGLNNGGASSVGTIAGGVVGGVCGLILVAVLAYLYRRKRKAQKEAQAAANKSSSSSVNGIDHNEPVFVDWDDIEKKFVENPTNNSNPSPMMAASNSYYNAANGHQNIVIANDAKYYPPNEIESPGEKTLIQGNRNLTMGLSPAMTAASASPSASTMVASPYRQSTVISSPDVSHTVAESHSPNMHSRNDTMLISQGFTNITKPDVGGG